MKPADVRLIGYSGHSYVVIEALQSQNTDVQNYYDIDKKTDNPFDLNFMGSEDDLGFTDSLQDDDWFIAVGNNYRRREIYQRVIAKVDIEPTLVIHLSAQVSRSATLGEGSFIGVNVCVNASSELGKGIICNTGAIIEHGCVVGDFCHIGPAAVLLGNVSVGENTFIGANSVVRQGVSIGSDAIIGAGSVVVKDVPDGAYLFGNPAKVRNP